MAGSDWREFWFFLFLFLSIWCLFSLFNSFNLLFSATTCMFGEINLYKMWSWIQIRISGLIRLRVGPNMYRIHSLVDVEALRHVTQSSSAVAERPRDALCPSVIRLNRIITRAESFIIVTYQCITLKLVVIHFMNSPWSVAAISVLHLLLERFTACSEARYRLAIEISAYLTCIRRSR